MKFYFISKKFKHITVPFSVLFGWQQVASPMKPIPTCSLAARIFNCNQFSPRRDGEPPSAQRKGLFWPLPSRYENNLTAEGRTGL